MFCATTLLLLPNSQVSPKMAATLKENTASKPPFPKDLLILPIRPGRSSILETSRWLLNLPPALSLLHSAPNTVGVDRPRER